MNIVFFSKKKEHLYKKFWDWFLINEHILYNIESNDTNNLVEIIGKKLSKIHTDLTFEMSLETTNEKRELRISADGIIEAFDHVINLVNNAPKLDRWSVIAFRQPNGLSSVSFNNFILKPENIFFFYESVVDGDKQKLNIDIYIKNIPINDDVINATFVLLDNFVGEYNVAKKLGEINFFELTLMKSNIYPIKMLESLMLEK